MLHDFSHTSVLRQMMIKNFNYYDAWKSVILECPSCGWKGTFDQGSVSHYNDLMESACPQCDGLDAPTLAIVSYPTTEESRATWEKLSDVDRMYVEVIEQKRAAYASRKLREPSQLPDIHSPAFTLLWDIAPDKSAHVTLIKHGETVIFSEPALYECYDRFIEVAKILRARYGSALHDLIPTPASEYYLYGDRIAAPDIVDEARKQIFGVAGIA
jgi:hypothetical protein